ncbi:hypothetical protein KAU33_02305 [Candidatus Dependentiae bacterium]|nr:hypothetical protein [Candidatus Dependentiae bacterium]
MNKKIHEIKTTPVVIVTESCPLNIFKVGYLNRKREYENCTKCDFFMGNNQCGYDSYETRLIEHKSETEEDDGSGALPDTEYSWDFKCKNCGHIVHFTSGFSVMSSGDQEKCSKCNTKHRYMGNSNGIYFFAIPIQDVNKSVED